MALIKEIILDNGITTNYHRIVSVNNITNLKSIIEVASYTSKEKREEEKQKLEQKLPMNIYKYTRYISKDYDESLNVNSAYSYLTTLDEFKDSKED